MRLRSYPDRLKTDAIAAENTAAKQRGRPFTKGQSGNPAGKPPGARHRATLAAEALFDGEAEALTRKAVEKAKEGDMTALRLCLERILPPRRDRPVAFKFPAVATTADAIKASSALPEATAKGDLTPGEAAELRKLVEVCIRAIQIGEIEERLVKLEARENDKGK